MLGGCTRFQSNACVMDLRKVLIFFAGSQSLLMRSMKWSSVKEGIVMMVMMMISHFRDVRAVLASEIYFM